VRDVLTIGHPLLRRRAHRVPREMLGSPELARLVADLVDTMRANDGIGIAAPQIGVQLRVAILEIPGDSQRYPGSPPMPRIVFVNPEVRILDPTTRGYWEGCLSVPNLRGFVERPRAVEVRFSGTDGSPAELTAEDFVATVVQHELDHLDGVLFVDRVRDTTKLATVENYRRFWADRSDPAGER